ncbi:Drug/Metabolite Transporter (DMT) Superfamily [Achlya hypogyna]|uniref:Drug/Metabolite Transporter (DMT) Superfamily n=1 Tax=Achlya hypogyna TaxID=1202772 RepID=A0A1V9ZL13_ACHHY|nr:Drug/Metabolite Transporter (DMT) Superfamily [Achlya hypogyna]
MDEETALSNVFAVDLHRASSLAGISYDELVNAMRSEKTMRMQGMLMEGDVESESDSTICDGKLDVYVLTSAKTTFFGVPYGLQRLGKRTVLEHALSQLLLAGLDRVVLAVPSTLPEIRVHIEQSVLFGQMHIDFIELLPTVLESIPKAVLAARHLFPGYFLVHAADRVFDQALLHRFDTFHRSNHSVCILAESNMDMANRMPSETVRVQYTPASTANTKMQLCVGRALTTYNGVVAGLYVVSKRIFLVLDNLEDGVGGLSLAESLAFGFRSLKCMLTNDSTWFPIDSDDQMLHVLEYNLVAKLSPFAFAAPANVAALSPPKQRKSVLLSVAPTSAETSTLLRQAQARSSRTSDNAVETFHGFVVNVPECPATDASQLLAPGSIPIHECALPGEVTLTKSRANEYMLAIPMPATAASAASPQKSAYLIEQSDASGSKFVLAVPDVDCPPLRRQSQLPSDVREVALAASATDGAIAVHLTVQKQVPMAGYVILVVALLSVSAQGAALQTLPSVSPFLKMFWRAFGSSCLFGAMAMASVGLGGWPRLDQPHRAALDAVVCVVSYVAYNATFFWALDHTSVGHAYIFSNSHSVLLVFGKWLLRQPVGSLESAGAVLGAFGGALTTLDNQPGDGSSVIQPSMRGDGVALLGAVGGVFYLVNAKVLREKLGVLVFVWFLFTSSWLLVLPLLSLLGVAYEVSTDSVVGLFGWVHHLSLELVIVGVCSGLGTIGFISAMRYFPPIVISVTMLLEPIVATVFSVLLGTADIPHALTLLGGLTVIIGTLLVVWSTRRTTEVVDVSTAMVPSAPALEATKSPKKRLSGYGTMS